MPKFKHGLCGTGIYRSWVSMKDRCDRIKNPRYMDYGGRGITYDPKWKDFLGFYEDMKDGWQKGLTIDRINNGGNYCKENCKWSTYKEQANNRRGKRAALYEYEGHQYTIKELAVLSGISQSAVRRRLLEYGLSVEAALSIPSGKGKANGIRLLEAI